MDVTFELFVCDQVFVCGFLNLSLMCITGRHAIVVYSISKLSCFVSFPPLAFMATARHEVPSAKYFILHFDRCVYVCVCFVYVKQHALKSCETIQ